MFPINDSNQVLLFHSTHLLPFPFGLKEETMARLGRSSRAERNIKEKNRRIYMKNLLARLESLLPPHPSKLSVTQILNQATSYIQLLQKNGELLKRKKALLRGDKTIDHNLTNNGLPTLPVIINIRTFDSILEVNLVSGSKKNFMLYEIISVLQEEGAEVIDAAHMISGDKIIYIIKSKAISPRIGVETSTVEERLKELVL